MTNTMPHQSGPGRDRRRLLALVRALNDNDLITLAVFLDLSAVAAAAGEPDGPDHAAVGASSLDPNRALVLDLAAAELERRLADAGVLVFRPPSAGGVLPPPPFAARACRRRRRRTARFPRGRGCRR